MQLKCLNPTIIRHPYLSLNLSRAVRYVLRGEVHVVTPYMASKYACEFDYKDWSPRKLNISIDDLDNCYSVSADGECAPLFYAVPCGKCTLCQEKKRCEWSFRAVCENNASQYPPYFITLTYNNAHLPANASLKKKDFQLFMKRLRINLLHWYGIKDIRYCVTGEYGSNFGRPHYHLVLWNIPFCDARKFLSELQKIWTFGFVYVKPCDAGSVYYVTKYLTKKATQNIGDREPEFFHASKSNGGLGAAYARTLINYYRSNPELVDIRIVDKYTGEERVFGISGWFKKFFFPTISQYFPKWVRDSYKKFNYLAQKRAYVISEWYNGENNPVILDGYVEVMEKYKALPFYNPQLSVTPFIRAEVNREMREHSMNHEDMLWYLDMEINQCLFNLILADIDVDEYDVISTQSRLHSEYVQDFIASQEDLNVKKIESDILKRRNLAQLREFF